MGYQYSSSWNKFSIYYFSLNNTVLKPCPNNNYSIVGRPTQAMKSRVPSAFLCTQVFFKN